MIATDNESGSDYELEVYRIKDLLYAPREITEAGRLLGDHDIAWLTECELSRLDT